jgi:hypothetical protein
MQLFVDIFSCPFFIYPHKSHSTNYILCNIMYCILRGLQVTINMLERSNYKTEWVGAASRSQMSGKHDFCLRGGVSQTLFTANRSGLSPKVFLYVIRLLLSFFARNNSVLMKMSGVASLTSARLLSWYC